MEVIVRIYAGDLVAFHRCVLAARNFLRPGWTVALPVLHVGDGAVGVLGVARRRVRLARRRRSTT
jgi:hypothetical protein